MNKEKSSKKILLIIIPIICVMLIIFAVIIGVIAGHIIKKRNNNNNDVNNNYTQLQNEDENEDENAPIIITADYKFDLKQNELSDFDISFLKAENSRENKVYSPLSIKYALKMLEEGAEGSSKKQISNVLGDYTVTKYSSNQNMSLANALFVRDSFKTRVNENYISKLLSDYDAELIFDPFSDADTVNGWVNRKTLGLVPQLLDSVDSDQDFILVNALGIDMEWKNRFYDPENYSKGFKDSVWYDHEDYYVSCNTDAVNKAEFDNGRLEISGMEFFASIDNYDIINELGEENIRKTVEKEYRAFIKENGTDSWGQKLSGSAEIDKEVSKYLDNYMKVLRSNYEDNKEASSIDFMLYADNDVKAFAKDLKTYNGTTLQYVCIMPVSQNLDEYIASTDSEKINSVINGLKDIKQENFKNGVITRVKGHLPKFGFEYNLNLMDDLKRIGITDVFDSKRANISKITSVKGEYISDAVHKANIELTQDGIKAAAATGLGGRGAGGESFNYRFEVPVEDIDLTFDNPFMFVIRDKSTGDIWFAGTVYEPLLWENDTTYESWE